MTCRGPLCLGLVALSLACGDGAPATEDEPAAPGLAAADDQPGAPDFAAAEPGALQGVPTETVEGMTGPGGQPFEVPLRTAELPPHLHRRIGVGTFETAMRRSGLTEYPCSSCHAPGATVAGPEPPEDAHAAIRPVHPAATGASCASCHQPEAVDWLVLQSGERVTLEHAYRLCAQCHFRQADDWAAGAHGKRIDGWQGRRVIMACTDCHDPHDPGLEKRVPFPGPRIPRTGREAP